MLLPTLSVGNKNYILANSITLLLNPDSKPARRIILDAKTSNKYIDFTKGKSGKCLILLDNGEVAMSFLSVKTIRKRYTDYIDLVNKENGKIVLEPFLDIGFDNCILPYKVQSIVNSNSVPIKKLIKNAKNSNTLIDCTQGRKTRSAFLLLNGYIITSKKDPNTIKDNYMNYMNNFYNVEYNEVSNEDEIEDNFENDEEIEDILELKGTKVGE